MKMKGIIVELERDVAAVLSDDGTVSKVKNKNYQIGDVIIMQKQRKSTRRVANIAACLIGILMIGGVSTWAYATPCSYVSLDVNPSIQYEVNRFDRVISYTFNNDAKEVVGQIELKNMNIKDAIEATINALADQDYISNGDLSEISISVFNKDSDKQHELVATLVDGAVQIARDNGIQDADVTGQAIGLERVQMARDLSTDDCVITPGKLNLILKMDPTLTDEEIMGYAETPVKEIMDTIHGDRTTGAAITGPAVTGPAVTGPAIGTGAAIHNKNLSQGTITTGKAVTD